MTSEPPYEPHQPAAPQLPPPSPYPPMHPSGLAGEERTNAMFAWLAAIIASMVVCGLGFVGPLIVLNTSGNRSAFVRAHAVESLNVQITIAIASLAATAVWFLFFIGSLFVPFIFFVGFLVLLLPLGVSIYGLVISIIGAVRANNGEMYRAPVAIRFVK